MSLYAYKAAQANTQRCPTEHVLTNLVQANLEDTLRENMINLAEADNPENTKKAFEPKMKEYFEFCKMLYPDNPYNAILSCDKMYCFMYYQAFHEKKTSGGR